MSDGTVALSHPALVEALRDGRPAGKLAALPDPRVDRFNAMSSEKIAVSVDDGELATPPAETFHLPVPEPFASMDLAATLLPLCLTEEHKVRVYVEVSEMERRGMVPLVRFLAWLASDWRKRGATWGVGRGSSCASLVLHLIGLHRVDPVEHDIPLDEFLR